MGWAPTQSPESFSFQKLFTTGLCVKSLLPCAGDKIENQGCEWLARVYAANRWLKGRWAWLQGPLCPIAPQQQCRWSSHRCLNNSTTEWRGISGWFGVALGSRTTQTVQHNVSEISSSYTVILHYNSITDDFKQNSYEIRFKEKKITIDTN